MKLDFICIQKTAIDDFDERDKNSKSDKNVISFNLNNKQPILLDINEEC